MIKSADLSPCGTYRYTLSRLWDESPPLTFVMLNPSTADAEVDDPTIRRCVGFARREGFGGIMVLNLFAYRTPSPKVLVRALRDDVDIIGPDNRYWTRLHPRGALKYNQPVVAAWGAHDAAASPGSALWHAFPDVEFVSLGATKSGAPRHPLYVSGDQEFVRWEP